MPTYKKASAVLTYDKDQKEERSLKLRITFDRKSRYFPARSGITFTREEFEAGRTKKVKTALEEGGPCLLAARGICDELGDSFDWAVFKKRYGDWYNGKTTVGSVDRFISLHEEYLASRPLELKTRQIYATAANWVERCSPGVRVCDITPGFVAEYLDFLRTTHRRETGRDISENTVRIYLRYLRALFSYAIKKGYMKCQNPVNTDRDFALSSIPRQKAALREAEWKAFLHHEPDGPGETFAKDFFIASMQMCGANIGDMLRLRNRDVRGDVIFFVRRKTRRNPLVIEVPMTDWLKGFFMRYGVLAPSSPDMYVLPFLAGATGPNNENGRIHRIVSRINGGLETFCKGAGIRRVTTYTARHTYATFGMAGGMSIGELQKFLGHSSASTTQTYLSSLTEKSIEKNRAILDSFMKE